MWKILKRSMSKRLWAYTILSIGFIVVQVWLDLKLPDYMSSITTLIETPGAEMNDILVQGGWMLLCALGSMAATMVVCFFAAKVAAGVAKTLRQKVYEQVMAFSMEEIGQFSTSSLINRNTNDITQVQTLISTGLQSVFKAPIMVIWTICKIAGKSWQWTLETGIAALIVIVVLAISLCVGIPRFARVQTNGDKLNRIAREHLTGIRVVRAYNAEEYQKEKYEDVNNTITKDSQTANRVIALISPVMTFVNSGLTLAVYWVGTFMIAQTPADGRLALFSDMVVFVNYAMQIIMAFMLLTMVFVILPRAQVSARRINEVLDTEVHIQDGKDITRENEQDTPRLGTVEFQDVSFSYPGSGAPVLEHISFKAEKGQTIAFIGATGSGKSTLISLIPRFYDASEGSVLVDGKNVKDYTQEALHDRIGYATQKATLFSGTVKENITFGDRGKDITDEDIQKASEISQSEEFLSKKEGKYEAAVSQGGSNFSGGQKQRLSIARTVAGNAEILIFDDSFSALDYKTDKAVRAALHEQCKDATIFIVAQRISTIRDADMIIVLDHGKAVGIGTHDELMKDCDVYREIASSQFSEAELASA